MVAPLDWGLGHATRCIPIIRALLNNGFEVMIAAEGAQAVLLQTEFPSVKILPLKGYRVKYSRNKNRLAFTLLVQLPKLIRTIRNENHWLNKIIDEHKIDFIISDNRFGLYTTKVPCVFITHQLTIKAPFRWLEKIIQRINYHYINQYTACWVPDIPGDTNAAGVLSHPEKNPKTGIEYIGLLSRFHKQTAVEKKYDYCILLSGPEPQRTLLEEKMIEGFSRMDKKILLVRGKPGVNEVLQPADHIEVKNHLPGKALEEVLQQSEYVISRSGYTTVMELLSLRKKSILIPTPGQTEQEYLAQKLQKERICMCVDQDVFDCNIHLAQAEKFMYSFPAFGLFTEEQIVKLIKE